MLFPILRKKNNKSILNHETYDAFPQSSLEKFLKVVQIMKLSMLLLTPHKKIIKSVLNHETFDAFAHSP